jgi:hypothetical protein
MAVYKFRITFEDYDDISREIEIKSNQTFEDFHKAIHASISFDGKAASSFYMSNDHWHKGKEITSMEGAAKAGTSTMDRSFLKNFIEDPHQKIYYIFNLDKPWTFLIELIKISIQENPKLTYPVCIKSSGEAPKQYNTVPVIGGVVNDDLDFLNQMDIDSEDEEDINEMGLDEGAQEEESGEEKSEFGEDEFNNSEEF